MCHDDVSVEGDIIPDRWEVGIGRRRYRRIVVERPEAMTRRVWRPKDLELGTGAIWRAEADCLRRVVQVGDAWGGCEQREAVLMRLRVLVVKVEAMFSVERLI